MPSALRTMVFLVLPLVVVVGACSLPTDAEDSEGACDSADTSGPCEGTFSCGNSGIQISCDKATSVCVVSSGSVNCRAVSGASASRCPSAQAAQAVAGCTTPFKPACSGSSGAGITVTCKQ
ncbi:MAG: hypothetical protein KIS78_02585 [Labilithrix sp.]|nr:hypothetical protein [Labilithrix sp.]